MKRVLDGIVALLVRGFFALLGRIPRTPARLLCRRIADLFFWFDARHRRIGLINLEIAFPEQSLQWRRRVLRDSFRRLGDLAVEISRFPRISPARLGRRFAYEPGRGLENYQSARAAARGRGILFVTAHVSAWEILPAAHAVQANPLSFVVRPLDNPGLDRWVNGWRHRFGNRTLAKQHVMRPILRALAAGRDVGFLIDQNVQEREGVYAPLFGKPASTTASVAALALKTGLPVVCGFVHPAGPKDRFQIRFYPPLFFTPSQDARADLLQATSRLNEHLEAVIREFPDCWLWGHRRFRTQPDGSDPYQR